MSVLGLSFELKVTSSDNPYEIHKTEYPPCCGSRGLACAYATLPPLPVRQDISFVRRLTARHHRCSASNIVAKGMFFSMRRNSLRRTKLPSAALAALRISGEGALIVDVLLRSPRLSCQLGAHYWAAKREDLGATDGQAITKAISDMGVLGVVSRSLKLRDTPQLCWMLARWHDSDASP